MKHTWAYNGAKMIAWRIFSSVVRNKLKNQVFWLRGYMRVSAAIHFPVKCHLFHSV